jgi:predicted extracellular nuclease
MEINIVRKINTANLLSAMIILPGAAASTHAVVINEIDYDQPGSDAVEFIEIFNPDINPVSLDGYTLDLLNGTNGSAYKSFVLTGLTIEANGYLVICGDSLSVANCNIDIASSNWIQNGSSDGDAVALFSEGTIVDAIAYEGIGGNLGSYAEGNSFTAADSNNISMSIARLPNGFDSDHNSEDFSSACITPGSANISGTGDCSVSVNPVPLPAAVWLFGSGLLGLIGICRRKNSSLAG